MLNDETIVKVGVSPYADAKYLFDDYRTRVASTLDLRFMARLAHCEERGLSGMSELYLKRSVDKSNQLSDWEAWTLSKRQITYAAADAENAVDLFKFFGNKIAPGKSANFIIENSGVADYINVNYGVQQLK